MNLSFLPRYLHSFNRYKWLVLALITAGLGIGGVMALQIEPVPKYIATGSLRGNELTDSVSETTRQIINQGQQFSQPEELVGLLLADNVIQAVANNVNLSPVEVRDRLLLKLPSPETSGSLLVMYQDNNSERALQTASGLMEAMVQQSQLINTARLKGVVEQLNLRLAQARQELQGAQQNLEQYYGVDEAKRSQLQQQVTLKQERLTQIQTALSEATTAQGEMISSLRIAESPQVAETKANQRFITTLALGAIAGLCLSALVILVLALVTNPLHYKAFRRQLLAAYKGRCPITGCDVEAALEVVRLDPNRLTRSSDIWNGLILRADIQRLFAAKQIAIEPGTLQVLLSPELGKTNYAKLAGRRLSVPEEEADQPNLDALDAHYRQCPWITDFTPKLEETNDLKSV
ncbi:hypothetical protein [Laspinema olomoucense]|uniref:hypothetical protein n=1 Tax=Laspinema olomoucense TaxID=3231600 RepID=UPI0021BA6299|nr:MULTISPECIES: hypothetical protein [unclassified Laspinema]MCT7971344.1 hypothetical protein [Laspinema sp. D3d]MCT7987217.1 hypothetical protein [Laspinema sp. D3a]